MKDLLDDAIAKVQTRLETVSNENASKLGTSLAVDFKDHFDYQQIQANAFAMGKISLRDAQICYIALGEVWNESNDGFSKGTNLATKAMVTQMIGELLSIKIRGN